MIIEFLVRITIFLILTTFNFTQAVSSPIVSRFTLSNGNKQFQHLIIDWTTGHLYAGATNALYQFIDISDSFQLFQKYRTGPQQDSPFCNYHGNCISPPTDPSKPRFFPNITRMDNYNQILLLYPPWDALISCGTLKQGVCTIHHLSNITNLIPIGGESIAVASNSVNASTVAFLGPNKIGPAVLYVGTTFTFDAYRDSIPSICTRSLDQSRPFQLVDTGDVTGQSGLMIRNEYGSDYRIYYMGGFTTDQYAYWISVQRKSVIHSRSPYISKLLRICHGDSRYETYSELPLECLGADNVRYNVIKAYYVGKLALDTEGNHGQFLIGVFVKTGDPWKMDPKQHSFHSAVCIFSFDDIQAAFAYSLQRCNSGIGKWNLPHFGFDQTCQKMNIHQHHSKEPSSNLTPCQPLRLGSEMPLTTVASINYHGPLLTSITAQVVDNRNVLFVGTNGGKLKKIYLQSIKNGREYDEVDLKYSHPTLYGNKSSFMVSTDHSVNSDMVFHSTGRYLYVITKQQLVKVRVESCAFYSTCQSCLASTDPYCGWCTMEGRCSRRQDCQSSQITFAFLPSTNENQICPSIQSVSPPNLSIRTPSNVTVTLKFNFLPSPETEDIYYQCIFGQTITTSKFIQPNNLQCYLPPMNNHQNISGDVGTDGKRVEVKITSGISGTVVYQFPFTFYNCAAYERCSTCSESPWPCHWCIWENKCLDQNKLCNVQVEPNQPHAWNSALSSLYETSQIPINQCPRIDTQKDFKLIIPTGMDISIRVPVVNFLMSKSGGNGLWCVVKIGNDEEMVTGRLSQNGNVVVCDKRRYSYREHMKTHLANFSLRTMDGVIIDEKQIILYKCELLGPDCTRCTNLDDRFQCNWCNGQCQNEQTCIENEYTKIFDCPSPKIENIMPLIGPMEGGTKLEIRGTDLGYRREDVDGGIMIAGRVPCRIVGYTPAEMIVCVTSATTGNINGPIEIQLTTDQTKFGRSMQIFRFVEISLFDVHPSKGPISGGTEIFITGTHLLVGSFSQVHIGSFPSEIQRSRSTTEQIICKTTSANSVNKIYDLTVTIDHANRTLFNAFQYTPDPLVSRIEPLISFRSGGRQLTIHGQYFTSIQRPLMFLLDSSTGHIASENSICQVVSSTIMLCPSPTLLPGVGALEYIVGFTMDSVESVKRLDQFVITVTEDPVFTPFHSGRKLVNPDELLILDGSNLNTSISVKDVRVTVADQPCPVVLITLTRLMCQVPSSVQHRETQYESNMLEPDTTVPVVTVRVGHLQFHLGSLIFDTETTSMLSTDTSPSGVWTIGLLGSLVAVCVVLIASGILIWIFRWKRRNQQNDKQYEPVQSRVDSQEYPYLAWPYGSGFGDTTLKQFPTFIPYHSRGVYARNVLFDDIDLSKIVTMDRTWGIENHHDQVFRLTEDFEQLLKNQHFLTILVNVLEQEKEMDRDHWVYLAGLLSVTLANDMHYYTDVVLTILKQIIHIRVKQGEKSIAENEASISDRLIRNWLALCMYDCVVDGEAGKALFQMYKVLNDWIANGPLDAITSQSYFTLVEENLLNSTVKFEQMQMHIIPPSTFPGSGRMVTCHVLSCDTIRQVKSKVLHVICMNTPFSNRLSVDDIDLEWRPESSKPRMILEEDNCFEEMSSANGERWRRMGTIDDCGLENYAVVAVCLRANSACPWNDESTHTYMSISSSSHLLSLSSLSPDTSANSTSRSTRTSDSTQNQHVQLKSSASTPPIKYFHLIRPPSVFVSSTPSNCKIDKPEIHLTRLQITKDAMQPYMDNLMHSIFTTDLHSMSPILQLLFRVVQAEFKETGSQDESYLAANWITNFYIRKFWTELINKPHLIFHLDDKSMAHSSMSILANVLEEACYFTKEHDSGSTVQNSLFIGDRLHLHQLMEQFCSELLIKPSVSQQELWADLAKLSKQYSHELKISGTALELFMYARRFREKVMIALSIDTNEEARKLKQQFDKISL